MKRNSFGMLNMATHAEASRSFSALHAPDKVW